MRVIFLGDIFGSPGRLAVQQQLPAIRAEHKPDLVIANAENARSGSGLAPSQYEKLRAIGIDAVTLGDHWNREPKIIPALESRTEPVARPLNISPKASGKTFLRLPIPGNPSRSLFIATVLGRVFFSLPADDPFAAVDHLLSQLPETKPIVIIEAHMEATSEKNALAHHLDGRVSAVVGSHTHIPTADARILPKGTGFITDMGMCGPYNSIIGRDIESVVAHMTTGTHVRFGMGEGDERVCGVLLDIDLRSGRTTNIERIDYPADRTKPPFTAT